MEMKNGQKNWYIPCIYYEIVKEMDTNKESIFFIIQCQALYIHHLEGLLDLTPQILHRLRR